MRLKHLFSRQTRLALGATPARNAVTWGVIVAVGILGFAFPNLLPWWGWLAVVAVEFVGLALLGRHWADKDIELFENDRES